MGGRDAVDNELSHRRVQMEGECTRDKMEEGGGPRVWCHCLDGLHGDKSDVVEGVTLNALDKGGAEGSVDLVPEGDGGCREGSSVSFDEKPSLSEGGGFPLLGGSGLGGGGFCLGWRGWGSCWGWCLLLLPLLCDRGPCWD